jgi:hypothetical protein
MKITGQTVMGLLALMFIGQATAVDCLVDGAQGTPLSKQFLASDWNRVGSGAEASFINEIHWGYGEFITDATLYCVGKNWQTSKLGGTKYPQLSINNFGNYLKFTQSDGGANLILTMEITDWSNNVILGSDWHGSGPGATCSVDSTLNGPNKCVIKFKPGPNSGEYVEYSRADNFVKVRFEATLMPPLNLSYHDPLASYYLVPNSGNLLDFVYFIPAGIGYINDIESVPNGCGDDEDGSNVEVPELPIPMSGRFGRAARGGGWEDPDPGGEETSCGGSVGSQISQTTIHLPIPLGGPGLAVNLSTCELTSKSYDLPMGQWSNGLVGQTGNDKPLNITLRCTGGLNNVAVVFEDPNANKSGVTPFSDGITLHKKNGQGQLKNFKAEVVYNGALVNIRPQGDTSLTDAISVGPQGTNYVGDFAQAPVTQPKINGFTVRLHQTGNIVDDNDDPYLGQFEGAIKYIMIYN